MPTAATTTATSLVEVQVARARPLPPPASLPPRLPRPLSQLRSRHGHEGTTMIVGRMTGIVLATGLARHAEIFDANLEPRMQDLRTSFAQSKVMQEA